MVITMHPKPHFWYTANDTFFIEEILIFVTWNLSMEFIKGFLLYSWFFRIWNQKTMLIMHFLHWLKWWLFFPPEIACIKLRLYVLLEFLLESTCKITWAKGRVNNILQYYFLYSLLVFFLEANFCSLYSNNSWYNCPTLIQGRDKEFTFVIAFLFCFCALHLDFHWDCSLLRAPTRFRVLNSTALLISAPGLVSCPAVATTLSLHCCQ